MIKLLKLLKKISLVFVFILIVAVFGTLAYVVHRAQDPAVYLEDLLVDPDYKIIKAFFSPDDDLKSILISLINSEKKYIYVAIYTLTQKDIAQALIDAYKRGVIIECVVDRYYGADKFSKVPRLANYKVPIWVYQTEDLIGALMHNKFAIFGQNILDKSIVWTGSYNFTNKASTSNQENIVILDNKNIIERFTQQFELLKKRSLLISGKVGISDYQNYQQEQKTKNYILDSAIKWLNKILRYFRI